LLPPFDQRQITFLQVLIAVVVAYIYNIFIKYIVFYCEILIGYVQYGKVLYESVLYWKPVLDEMLQALSPIRLFDVDQREVTKIYLRLSLLTNKGEHSIFSQSEQIYIDTIERDEKKSQTP
jgi:hypothetical protein